MESNTSERSNAPRSRAPRTHPVIRRRRRRNALAAQNLRGRRGRRRSRGGRGRGELPRRVDRRHHPRVVHPRVVHPRVVHPRVVPAGVALAPRPNRDTSARARTAGKAGFGEAPSPGYARSSTSTGPSRRERAEPRARPPPLPRSPPLSPRGVRGPAPWPPRLRQDRARRRRRTSPRPFPDRRAAHRNATLAPVTSLISRMVAPRGPMSTRLVRTRHALRHRILAPGEDVRPGAARSVGGRPGRRMRGEDPFARRDGGGGDPTGRADRDELFRPRAPPARRTPSPRTDDEWCFRPVRRRTLRGDARRFAVRSHPDEARGPRRDSRRFSRRRGRGRRRPRWRESPRRRRHVAARSTAEMTHSPVPLLTRTRAPVRASTSLTTAPPAPMTRPSARDASTRES